MTEPRDNLQTTLTWVVRVGVFLVPLAFLFAPENFSRVMERDPNPNPLGWPLHAVNAVFSRFPPIAYAFEAWRNFGFRMLVEVTFGFWVLLALLDRRYWPRRSALLGALTVFMVVMLVANLAGVSPYRSLWSNIERMQGYINLLHLFAFFVVASSVLTSERLWRTLFWISMGVCAVFCYEAIYLQWGMFIDPRGGSFEFRLEGRMASPVFLAVFVLLHIGLAVFWAVRAPGWKGRVAYAGLLALYLLALWMTGTRAAWAGLAAGGGVTVALLALRGDSRRMRRVGLVGCVVVAVVSAVLVGMVFLANESWNQSSVLERFAHTQERVRLMVDVWEIAAAGFLDYPILGWGQENFGYVFDEHFDGVFLERAWMWSDRCHNVFLSWALAGGVLGLLAYVAIFWGALKVTWRPSEPAFLRVRDKAVLTGILVGYLVYDSAQLDNVTSYVVVFAILAFMHWTTVQNAEVAGAEPRPNGWIAAAAAPIVLLAVGWGGIEWANLRAIRTSAAAERCKGNLVVQDENGTRLTIEEALVEDCFATGEVRETASLWAQQIHLSPHLPPPVRKRFVHVATEEMIKEVQVYPRRVRTLFLTARLMARTGKPKQAIEYLEAARALSPNRPRIYFEFGEVYRRIGKPEKSLEYYRLGASFSDTNRATLFMIAGIKQIIKVYVGRGNWDRALELCKELVDTEKLSYRIVEETMDWMIKHEPPDRAKFDELHRYVKKLRRDNPPPNTRKRQRG